MTFDLPTITLLSSPDAFAAQRIGGVSRYFSELLTRLPSHHVDVHMPYGVHRSTIPPPGHRLVAVPGNRHPAKMLAAVQLINRQSTALQLTLGHPDVYHPTYYSAPIGRRRGARVVTVFDMAHERMPGAYRHDDIRQQKREWCEAADLVLAISQFTKEEAVDILGLDPGKVVVTPLAPFGVVDDVPATSQHGRPAFVLVVGQRWPHKDFPTAIRALRRAQLPEDTKVVLFGTAALTIEEQSLVTAAGMRDRVVTLTGGDDSTLDSLYRSALCLLYPSRYEGFGLPILEAMARGCPVVCSDIPVHREVAHDAALFFEAGNADDAAHQLSRLASSGADRQAAATAGRRNASRYSWGRTVELTVSAYRLLRP